MDIDLPPSGGAYYDFASTFPLPFRVLFLSFATLAGFATNLHLLAFLGIDTSLVLDVRLDDYRIGPNQRVSSAPAPFVHPSRLYPPIYSLAFLGLAWTTLGWIIFANITGGVPEEMVKWRAIPAITAIAVGGAAISPWNVLFRRERFMFLRALRRTILSPLYSAVPFSDIILADILTSSAKVLGDVWVSGCLLFTVTERFGMGGADTADSCARVFMVPVMTSLPYLFRFRQCVSEVVTGSTPTPKRSVMNALKYASAFPVIFFSAMQSVVGDPFDEVEVEAAKSAWIGRTALFNLWVFAVLINSLYSFWWDVTNDWGLSLLTRAGWGSTQSAYAFVNPPAPGSTQPSRRASFPPAPHQHVHGSSRDDPRRKTSVAFLTPEPVSTAYPPPPSRPTSPAVSTFVTSPSKSYHGLGGGLSGTSSPAAPSSPASSSTSTPSTPRRSILHARAFSTAAVPNITFPFLRPILLLPDPYIYYLAVTLDLILRFTWSLKLSSHLHSIHEIESGIFLMEALEVVRRWMWVFLRVEWEAVRKGGGGLQLDARDGEMRLRAQEEEDELGRRVGHREEYRDVVTAEIEDEVGLGILVEKTVGKH